MTPERTSRLREALTRGPVVLDGGLATTLEAAGADLDGALWSARLLVEDPDAVLGAHLAFLRAGAQVCTTASYQASVDGFALLGLDRAAAVAAIRRSVDLAREAVAHWRAESGSAAPRWVAGSVGPYGASRADGSEYTGAYDLDAARLESFHAPRLEALADARVDVVAIETQPRLDEALIALGLARAHGLDPWVSFTTPDGARLPDGTRIVEAVGAARDDGAFAVGVNCCSPAAAAAALALIAGTGPTVAYPNLGDRWDAEARRWVPRGGPAPLASVEADLVGGCCGTSPRDIATLCLRLGLSDSRRSGTGAPTAARRSPG